MNNVSKSEARLDGGCHPPVGHRGIDARMARTFLLVSICGAFLASCLSLSSAMDALGREAAVTETEKNAAVIEDDKIEDKHPSCDPNRTVDELFGEQCLVRLNKSGSVTELDIA